MNKLAVPLDSVPALNEAEFSCFRRFIYEEAGISLAANKRELVQSRLIKRLQVLKFGSFGVYWRYLQQPGNSAERQRAINLLSTNETYFFREPEHFVWLQNHVSELSQRGCAPIRIWSAACSTGEEPYNIAMILAESLGLSSNWKILGTDINTHVLAFARRAIYSHARVNKTPPLLWRRYFQQGKDEYAEKVRVRPELTKKVQLGQLNLLQCADLRDGDFDVVFLRNVLIYFDDKTKADILAQLCRKIKVGGYLLIGHSEVIRFPDLPLLMEGPSRYRYAPQIPTQKTDK